MPITDLPGYPGLATLVESFIIKIGDAQAAYFIEHDKFFQGLNLVEGEPNGVQRNQANTTSKPDDQEHSWKTFDPTVFGAVMSLPVNMKSHVYDNEDGWGYKIIFEFWRDDLGPDEVGNNGRHWMKRHNKKPDGTSVTTDWYIVYEGEA